MGTSRARTPAINASNYICSGEMSSSSSFAVVVLSCATHCEFGVGGPHGSLKLYFRENLIGQDINFERMMVMTINALDIIYTAERER